ncbi:hypothetical protein BaRGS_00009447 [Batillaria attramentaria]|uniref:Uncharacterized protein n=1 Tax=Batillaria attramentaria TaxID=370345 RepID=A0ABD0LI00_9CAEN
MIFKYQAYSYTCHGDCIMSSDLNLYLKTPIQPAPGPMSTQTDQRKKPFTMEAVASMSGSLMERKPALQFPEESSPPTSELKSWPSHSG